MAGADVFLDSSYVIALSIPKDDCHDRAVRLAEAMRGSPGRLVTTTGVLLEVGNFLAKRRYRAAAVDLLESLKDDPSVEIVVISARIYKKALALYRERPDKEWGLTDCCSFVVMREKGLTDALTADEHFKQAGFRALLLE